MKLYICTDHDCHFPVGVASIVIADDRAEAIELLDKELISDGLRSFIHVPYTLTEVDCNKKQAIILDDGNY